MSTRPKRLRANSLMFAGELFTEMLKATRQKKLVTHWVLEPRTPGGGDDIEFEIRITKIGDTRMPRSLKGIA